MLSEMGEKRRLAKKVERGAVFDLFRRPQDCPSPLPPQTGPVLHRPHQPAAGGRAGVRGAAPQ